MGESSSYAEVIVHDERDIPGKRLNIGLIFVTAILLAYGFLFEPRVLLLGIVMVPVSVVMIKNRYREYEYLLVSDELDISVVKNRSRRKKIKSYVLNDLQCMAPVKSHRLDAYHSNPRLKVFDYSSGNKDHEVYGMIFSKSGMLQEIRVEPTQAMLNEVQVRHASVVFFD